MRRRSTTVPETPLAVALVHDYLVQMGGAERVLAHFMRQFPGAPIYTSVHDARRAFPEFRPELVRTSFLQKLPCARRHYQKYLSLYPLAFEQFDLRDYDLVLSSSSAFAKGVITRPETCHICYCHTPMRFAWDYHTFRARERWGIVAETALPLLIRRLRLWDRLSADRVDHFIANSRVVANRIRKHYGREAVVIPPPIDVQQYRPLTGVEREVGAASEAYLVLSRLAPYKRVDLAVEAFNILKRPLVIVGEGRDLGRLRRMAGPTIRFLGRLPDEQVKEYLARCRALIFPGEEDFGLVPVEAMASGIPVIAYAAGGALETVDEGVTGVFFDAPSAQALAAAVRRSDQIRWEPERIRHRAGRFDVKRFDEQIGQFVEECYLQHQHAYNLRDRESAYPRLVRVHS
jgi:glycosyltransferase involved in cell wall biosynthesis